MKQFIFLSIVFSLLSILINNEEVLATGEKRASNNRPPPPAGSTTKTTNIGPLDPRQAPVKYCDSKCIPTVRPPASIDIKKDVSSLHNAMKGFGTNEKGIIDILTKRGIVQRLQIHDAYLKAGHGSVVSSLRGELDGAFKRSILALMTPLPTFFANELHESLSKGPDDLLLVEILCTISNFGVKSIAEFYKITYGTTLEAAVKGRTTGSFQRIMLSLIQGKRDANKNVNREKVVADAKALSKPGPKNWNAAESQFDIILGTRSYPHLREVFIEYAKLSGHEIEVDIKKEFPEFKGVLAIVKCIKMKDKFLAIRLEDSMRLKGTRDRALIRILVSRSEIDLGAVKAEYHKLYKRQLQDTVANEIGGDFRSTLTNLIKG